MIPSSLLNRPFFPIATERLILRPLKEEDGAPMTALANDIKVAEKLARLPHPYTLEEAYKYITYAQEGIKKGTHVCLAVVRREDHAFMGIVGLEDEIGYWLGFKFWGQGYGREAVKALVHFAFFVLGKNEIQGGALEDNIPSRRIFEGLGSVQTGIRLGASYGYKGRKPVITYALSRKDFLEHYNAIKRPLVWVVAAALVNEKEEILITERPSGKPMSGIWELPGGKIEKGEAPEQALVRELKEELHIDVHEEDLEPLSFASHRYDTFHLIMPFYLCRQWKGTPHGAEGQKLAWASYDDFICTPLLPADILLVHRLADALKSKEIWAKEGSTS